MELMRTTARAALPAVISGLMLCTACGDDGPTEAAQTRPVEPGPNTPCPTGTPVVAYGNARDPVAVRWVKAEPVSAGRGLVVTWRSGVAPCRVLDRVDVLYQPHILQVTLYEGADPATPDPVCAQILVTKSTMVRLSEPVHNRKIVDGAARSTP